ncbi:MAG: hypothetical protein U9N87_07135 [Planctomycetota bacterium]|nr:hypothetical protein [Planctomycetota bacterium]
MSKIKIKPLTGVTLLLLAISLFSGPSTFAAGGKRVVIPFDFVSKFDDGRYGQKMGDMVWKKLSREGGVIIPETMLDVRDTVTSNNIKLAPDTPLDKVKSVVVDDFGADVGIWGSVERVPGHDWDVYDLKIRCVDFSTTPEPKVIYECNARTKTVSEIPHVYVKAMLDKLYGRQPGGPAKPDPLAEKNWETGKNLVTGGDFQSGAGGVPKGWASRGGQQREPLGGLVSWQRDTADPRNRVIRFTFDKGVGDGFGVMYYSDPFPIEENALYRFQCRYRSNGPKIIVFIKCYDEVGSTYKQREKSPGEQSPGARANARDTTAPGSVQRRECYRSQNNLKGPKNAWNTYTNDFTPKHTKYTPTSGRVMLYSYLGAGVVEFDDVVIKQIVPASPGASHKERRHSLETGVTIKEMEENERKSRELKEKRREEQ